MTEYRRPESVLVVVATNAGDVLLLRRHEPNDYWQSVTGSLEWNEEPSAAAQRELHEETGIDARPVASGQVNTYPIIPPWTKKFAPDVTRNREHVFLLRLDARVPITLNSDEHAGFRWLPAAEAAKLAGSSTNRAAILELVAGPLKR